MKIRFINIFLLIFLVVFVVYVVANKVNTEMNKRYVNLTINGKTGVIVYDARVPCEKVVYMDKFKYEVCAILDSRARKLFVFLPGVQPTPCYELSMVKNIVIFTNTPKGQPTVITTWANHPNDPNYETIEIRLHSDKEFIFM